MDKVTASEAKQAFGNVLARAAVSPVAIEKHGKVVAAMVSPAWLERSQQWDDADSLFALLSEARRLCGHSDYVVIGSLCG